MKNRASDSPANRKVSEIRLDRLLGRRVLGRNNRSVGRLEEARADVRRGGPVIADFVIGAAGLLERLGVGARLLFGRRPTARVARWDQLDISDPERPRLRCDLEDLAQL